MGRRGEINKDTLSKIASDIEEVSTNTSYRENVAKMSDLFHKLSEGIRMLLPLLRNIW